MELFSGDEEKVKRLEALIAKDMGFDACVPFRGRRIQEKTDSYFLSVLSGLCTKRIQIFKRFKAAAIL